MVAVLLAGIAYVDGRSLPVEHVVTVTEDVQKPPAQVYARILDVASEPGWRPEIASVKVLPPEAGRACWVETMRDGSTRHSMAVETTPFTPTPPGEITDREKVLGRRVVRMEEPSGGSGGTWVYEVAETRSNEGGIETRLKITETGYIKSPIGRFLRTHVFGMDRNLRLYADQV